MILIILVLISVYFILSWLSHYENLSYGRTIPYWLCIFCLKDKIKEI